MKLIQRYAHYQDAINLGAGVYYSTGNIGLTPKFNVIINKIAITAEAFDSVTGQFLPFTLALECLTEGIFKNPAIQGADVDDLWLSSNNGIVTEVDVYGELGAGESLTFTAHLRLNQVTANGVWTRNRTKFGYLCPEDYLGNDIFAANPL